MTAGTSTAARVAVVTGGAGGLGRAVAAVLLDDGFRVAVLDRERSAQAAADLSAGAAVDRVIGVDADVTDETSVRSALDRVQGIWGRVDALVNNAGIEPPHSIEDVARETWTSTLEVNLTGAALMIKHCIPRWRAAGGGRVVSIGSRVWVAGGATPAYAASKAGLVGMTRSVCHELGALGVTANVVAPSFVPTPLHDGKGEVITVEERIARFAAAAPTGRIVEPVDVAHAVAFLLSDRARAITGEVLHVAAGTQLAPSAT